MSRRTVPFLDPAGERFGTPTWPYRMAPDHLATRLQLAEMGLRPTAAPVGQVAWRGRPGRRAPGAGYRTAALYHLADTVLRSAPSVGRLVQLGAARSRRRVCPTCSLDVGYVIAAHLGECLDCDESRRAA